MNKNDAFTGWFIAVMNTGQTKIKNNFKKQFVLAVLKYAVLHVFTLFRYTVISVNRI